MNRSSTCRVSKVCSKIALKSKQVIKHLKEKESWSWSLDKEYDLFLLTIGAEEYTVVFSSNGCLKKEMNIGFCVFLLGNYKDLEDAENNSDKVVLSFPIWYLSDEEVLEQDKETKDQLNNLKKLYVNDSVYGNTVFNPKFASMNVDVVSPLLDYILPDEDNFLVSEYKDEVKLSLRSINQVMELFQNAYQHLVENPKQMKKYQSLEKPFSIFDEKGARYFVGATGSQSFILKSEEKEMKSWLFDLDKYYSFDDNDEPLFEQELSVKEILKDTKTFAKWISNQSPDAIWNSEKALKDGFLSEGIETQFIHYGLETSAIKEYCGFEHNIYINNLEELMTSELGYESKYSLMLWVLFGNSGFHWDNGRLTSPDQLIPYSRCSVLLTGKKEEALIVPSEMLKHNKAANILNLPEDLDASFIPFIKEGYDWLLESNNGDIDDKEIKKLKAHLTERGVL